MSNQSRRFSFNSKPAGAGVAAPQFRQSRLTFILFGLVLLLACSPPSWSAAPSQNNSAFVSIDAPDASAAMYRGTVALAIDAAGDVAGVYSDSNNVVHSFVRSAAGTITEFDAPLVNGIADQATIPMGFDAAGDLVGVYIDSTGHTHGFMRSAAGVIKSIDATSAGTAGGGISGDTIPTYIDSAGDVAGIYVDSSQVTHGFLLPAGGSIVTFQAAPVTVGAGGDSPGTDYVTVNTAGEAAGTYVDVNSVVHGFVRSSSGAITTIDVSAAGTGSAQGTAITAIDSAGDVGGLYTDSNNIAHGFVRTSTGTVSTFNAPATAGTSPGIFPVSYPFRFDAAGDLSGVYLDSNDVVYGFVRSSAGTITTFTAPDAAPMPTTSNSSITRLYRRSKFGVKFRSFAQRRLRLVSGFPGAMKHNASLLEAANINVSLPSEIDGTAGLAINSPGAITGVYTDSDSGLHSFIRTPAGAITEFADPDAGPGVYQGTVAFAINDSGTVAGTYLDTNSDLHGFVAALGQTATTVTLTAVPTSAVYGQPVTLTATVAAGTATPPDGETVQFMIGSTSLGSATTSSGTATLTTTSLPVATNSITAAYVGDSTYAGSTSNAVSVEVGTATTSLRLASSPNPSTVGQAVTFTATVTEEYGGTATGTVTFSSGSTTLGSASLNGDIATFSDSSLAAGTYNVVAVYGGDSNFQSSTSAAVSQVVNAAAAPGFSLSASPTSLTVQSGGQGTVTLTVTPVDGFNSTVSFACSGLPSGASCTFSPSTVTPTTSAAVPTTLTIAAGTTSAASQSHPTPFLPATTLALGTCLLAWKRRRAVRYLALLAFIGASLAVLSGCSSSSSSTPPPVVSTVTVTATSGSIAQTATVTLTVN
ncbi:MAG TPA: Ig-like domain-containing protein [Terracidiphilus sp.]|nr:Ig-like domain-containing protein [Terracidiphilus sp.]